MIFAALFTPLGFIVQMGEGGDKNEPRQIKNDRLLLIIYLYC
jgi:hypothetical protein